jgi:NitT/TauT family transport system ATP-binding protein
MNEIKSQHIKISNLKKEVKNNIGFTEVLINDLTVDIELEPKNITAILVPQGGAEMAKLIAGLEVINAGKIELNGADKVIYIPRKPSSFPWLNVENNIRFVLDRSSINEEEKTNKIKFLLELTGLDDYEKHFPDNKSLGFRFRISLARALAAAPEIILMDNSLDGMERQTKGEAYSLLKSIAKKVNSHLIYSTNNISEAVTLSKNVFVFGKKPLEYCGQIDLDGISAHEGRINKVAEVINGNNLSGFKI